MAKRWTAAMALLLPVLATVPAAADTWAPPKTTTYASADGTWRLVVEPRPVVNPLVYFEDKVAGKANAGAAAGETRTRATGRMQQRNGEWHVSWEKPLVNEVAPVEVVVSNQGATAAFDNWHSMGHGSSAIATYGSDGSLIRRMALSDFLPETYVAALPRSVSSISWRGAPRFSDSQQELIVPVVVPEAGHPGTGIFEKATYVDVRFRLSDGQRVIIDHDAWSAALDRAGEAYDQQQEDENEARERFVSPLTAPATNDAGDWHAYLVEAYLRTVPDGRDHYPATQVIPLREDEGFSRLSGYLGDALAERLDTDETAVIGSPSQSVMIDVLREQITRVKPGSPCLARVYVATDRIARFLRGPNASSDIWGGMRTIRIDHASVRRIRRSRFALRLNSGVSTRTHRSKGRYESIARCTGRRSYGRQSGVRCRVR